MSGVTLFRTLSLNMFDEQTPNQDLTHLPLQVPCPRGRKMPCSRLEPSSASGSADISMAIAEVKGGLDRTIQTLPLLQMVCDQMSSYPQDRDNSPSSCAGLFIASHIGFDWPGVWVHLDIAAPVHAVSASGMLLKARQLAHAC